MFKKGSKKPAVAPKRIGGPKGTTPMVDSTQPPMQPMQQQAFAKGGMASKANCYADGGRVDAMCFNNGPGGAKNYKK